MVKEYGYEYDATLDEELWEQTKKKVTYDKLWGATCLRSGRDALKTIAREYEPTMVYMPALACDSMVLPFEMYGHNIVYYKLNDDYSIDLNYLKSVVSEGLFLYMDYFGVKAITDEELVELRSSYPGLIFIEDRTQNLIWDRTSLFQPEYIMASLRKWINIPDGGLLWNYAELKNRNFGEDTSFSATRLKAQCMRNEFFQNGDEDIKIAYRKIFSTVSDIMDEDKEPSRMSAYAYSMAINADWNKVREQRQENAKKLIDILENSDVRFIQSKTGKSDLYVAFMIDDRDLRQSKLSSQGIFNTIIWPLSEEQKKICNVAKYTEGHMLAAPCDQRYSVRDMQFIGDEIVKVIKNIS